MVMKFFAFVAILALANADKAPYPCDGNIIIGYDTSNQLNSTNFAKQINFLKSQVFNNQWTNLNRLALLDYARYTNIAPYGSFSSVSDIDWYLGVETQVASAGPNLRIALQNIISNNMVNASQPSHIIIGVSKIDAGITSDAKTLVDKINSANGVVTFLALGSDVNLNMLQALSPNVIQWDIDNDDVPQNWEQQFWAGYGCASQTLPTTQASPSYTPCQKRIVFSIDSSDSNQYYVPLQRFLVNQVFASNWNYVDRLGLEWYSNRAEARLRFGFFGDGTSRDLESVRKYINSRQRFPGTSPNLLAEFQSLALNFGSNEEFTEVRYIVFISQKLDQQIVDSIRGYAYQLNQSGRLTIIGLGNIDPGRKYLQQLTSTFLIWHSPNTDSVPANNWESFFWSQAYGCDSPLPSSSPPPPAFLPCSKQVAVLFDSSHVLSASSYSKLTQFIGNRMFNNFTHFERLALGYYNTLPVLYGPGFFSNQSDVNTYVSSISQSQRPSNVRKALQFLSNNQYPSDLGQSVVLFVGRLNDNDVDGSIEYAEAIKKFARLSIIGVQSTVLKTNLDQLADFSYVLDLNNIPRNVDDILAQAYGCNN